MDKEFFDQKYFRSLPKWCKKIDTRVWFLDCHEDMFPKTLVQIIKLGLNFTPIPNQNVLERTVFNEYPQLRGQVRVRDSTLYNITKKAKPFIANYLVTETDKNMGPAIISKMKFYSLTNNLFEDESTFAKLHWYPNDIIRQYELDVSKLELDTDLKYLLQVKEKERKLPEFTGLPKVHKKELALRPVINAASCFTTTMSKILQSVLRERLEYMDKINPWNIHSADQYISRLQGISITDGQQYKIDALDIKSLYPNIPHEFIHEAIKFSFEAFPFSFEFKWKKKHYPITINQVKTLTKIYLKYNILSYKTEGTINVIRQIKGIPTGGNVSPTLAMMALSLREIIFRDLNNSLFEKYYFSGRYLDDLIIITDDQGYDAQILCQLIYDGKFEFERPGEIGDIQVFLDLEITLNRTGKTMEWKLYRKPNNSYCYIHYYSYIPNHIKTGFIIGEKKRILRRCKERCDVEKEMKFFTAELMKRGYTQKFIKAAFRKADEPQKEYHNAGKQEWVVIKYLEGVNIAEVMENHDYDNKKLAFSMHRKLINLLA